MAYWLDEGSHRWTQIDEAGTAAAGLYWRCGSYIADEGTDGFIPAARARMYGTSEWIARLVEVGLWTVEEKGFRDTRYFELNKTAAEVKKKKQQHAARQSKYVARLTRQLRDSDASHDASATRLPIPSPSGNRARGKRGATLRTVHEFDDDGTGLCLRCNLIYANQVHGVAS